MLVWAKVLLAASYFSLLTPYSFQQSPKQPVDLNKLFKDVFSPPEETQQYRDQISGNLEECICVPYFQCGHNRTIITDGEGLLDVRSKSDCENSIDICCYKPLEDKSNPQQPDIEPTPPSPPPPASWRGCGYRNELGIAMRIKNDQDGDTLFGEFPWMIAVLREENGIMVYQCGGSLIHPQVVLTAAHCVLRRDPTKLVIRAGEWDTQSQSELINHQQQGVDRIITHNDFYSGGLYNDIALIVLNEPFSLAENVDTICLPMNGAIFNDRNCIATGWGKDKFETGGEYQTILKKVELPMVPYHRCQDELRKTRLGHRFNLHGSFVCAGGEQGKDTCKGDGGSPLVCPIPGFKDRYQQVGIVAWGIGCSSNVPGVYVNVAGFKDWIDYHMKCLNLETNPYHA